jgi:hypothetical protein
MTMSHGVRTAGFRVDADASIHQQFLTYVTSPDGELLTGAIRFFSADPPAPGSLVWGRLVGYHTSADVRRRPSTFDLALAYACGWRGPGALRLGRPGGIGETAVLGLLEQVRASVFASARLLYEQTGLDLVSRDDRLSLPGALTMSLLGACDCRHHRRDCGNRCGRDCCFPDHDIRTWDPDSCHLRPFIDQAVRGTAQRRILGGAFAESMLYRTIEAEGRVLCRTVEWGCCEVCGHSFEGQVCPNPHASAATAAVRRVPRKNQIIVPAIGAGAGHVPLDRWWCRDCDHLYGVARRRQVQSACPRCGRPPSACKAVWILAGRSPVADCVLQ